MGRDTKGELSLDVLMRLYSRTWRTGQTALIKTTSFVSELAEDLLSQDRQARALVLSVTPPVYLRTILGGASSRAESKAMREMRRARLQRRLDLAVEVQTEGEWIAMSWLCEALCLDRVATRFGERVMWLDFDRFLAEPAEHLGILFSHFDPATGPPLAPTLIAGDLIRRYSKAPEHAYDDDLRRAVLAQAQNEHGPAIRAGMDWLQRVVSRHPEAMTALRRPARAARGLGATRTSLI